MWRLYLSGIELCLLIFILALVGMDRRQESPLTLPRDEGEATEHDGRGCVLRAQPTCAQMLSRAKEMESAESGIRGVAAGEGNALQTYKVETKLRYAH